MEKYQILTILAGIVIFAISIFIAFIKLQAKNETQQKQNYTPNKKTTYEQNPKSNYKRKRLITPTEIAFGNAIKKTIPNGYRLYPQVCLASIINKTTNNHYVSELFRIIDFGIFDENYNVILLIEINDSTHRERKRIARDYKVENICNAAGIPLIHFWTEYGVNQEYISKRLQSYFPIAQATENK